MGIGLGLLGLVVGSVFIVRADCAPVRPGAHRIAHDARPDEPALGLRSLGDRARRPTWRWVVAHLPGVGRAARHRSAARRLGRSNGAAGGAHHQRLGLALDDGTIGEVVVARWGATGQR